MNIDSASYLSRKKKEYLKVFRVPWVYIDPWDPINGSPAFERLMRCGVEARILKPGSPSEAADMANASLINSALEQVKGLKKNTIFDSSKIILSVEG